MDRRPSGLSETERNLLSSRNFLIVAFVLFLTSSPGLHINKKPHDIAISWGFVHPILQCKDHSTINVQVAAGRTSSPAGAAAGAISGSALPSPRTSALPLQSMVWERRVSAESW